MKYESIKKWTTVVPEKMLLKQLTESAALFPVLGRRAAPLLMKESAEIQRIIITDDLRNFIYGIIRSLQQDLCIGDTKRGEEL